MAEDDNQLKLAEHQRPESHLFEYASDNETVVIDDDSVDNAEKLENVITIETLTTDRRMVHMRALLDTGSKSNFIRARKARSTRHHIHPYTRKTRFVSGSGESLYPIGELVMTFRRVSPSGTREPRTFQIRFLVVPDSVPFDVILGIGFCQGAQVFKPGEFFCPLVRPKETDGNKTDTGGDGRGLIFDAAEKQEKEKRKAEQKKTNEEAKKKEREEQAKKRAAAQAAKNSQKP